MDSKTAVIHIVTADSDILSDIGWLGIDMYVAVNHVISEVVGGDISWQALKDRLTAEGWSVVDEDEVFYHIGDKWFRKES